MSHSLAKKIFGDIGGTDKEVIKALYFFANGKLTNDLAWLLIKAIMKWF